MPKKYNIKPQSKTFAWGVVNAIVIDRNSIIDPEYILYKASDNSEFIDVVNKNNVKVIIDSQNKNGWIALLSTASKRDKRPECNGQIVLPNNSERLAGRPHIERRFGNGAVAETILAKIPDNSWARITTVDFYRHYIWFGESEAYTIPENELGLFLSTHDDINSPCF